MRERFFPGEPLEDIPLDLGPFPWFSYIHLPIDTKPLPKIVRCPNLLPCYLTLGETIMKKGFAATMSFWRPTQATYSYRYTLYSGTYPCTPTVGIQLVSPGGPHKKPTPRVLRSRFVVPGEAPSLPGVETNTRCAQPSYPQMEPSFRLHQLEGLTTEYSFFSSEVYLRFLDRNNSDPCKSITLSPTENLHQIRWDSQNIHKRVANHSTTSPIQG